jgi:2-keto-4-pentenoate hydratase
MMSNGAFVVGDDQPAWRTMDLVNIPVSLTFDDTVAVEKNGGHALGDPFSLAVDMVNRLRATTGVRAGQMITTGAYTGMNVAKRGQRVSVRFAGFPVCTVTTT